MGVLLSRSKWISVQLIAVNNGAFALVNDYKKTKFCELIRGWDLGVEIDVGRSESAAKLLKRFGGPGRDRTDDLFHAMEARSQLRHRPTQRFAVIPATLSFSRTLSAKSNLPTKDVHFQPPSFAVS
jgi:hypothetical protein